MIPYSTQYITQDDIKAVSSALKSTMITQGKEVELFETDCSKILNSKYSLAVNSATSALYMACKALDIKEGDFVWTVPNTFVASANAPLLCGAKIDFVDIEIDSFNICINSLKKKLELASKKNILPKALIIVHFGGLACDLKSVHSLSKKYDFKVIEDASHAFGTKYLNSKIGDCKYSEMCIFSFHAVKIITTGEGGLITTKNKRYFEKLSKIRSHGITRLSKELKNKHKPDYYYEQQDIGLNFRMTSFQAALGSSQLKKIKKMHQKRTLRVSRYIEAFKSNKFIKIQKGVFNSSLDSSSHHLFPILAQRRDDLYEYLQRNKIGVNVHYLPVHLQPFYRKLGFKRGDFPNSEKYSKMTLSLPLFPELRLKDQDYVINKINKFYLS